MPAAGLRAAGMSHGAVLGDWTFRGKWLSRPGHADRHRLVKASEYQIWRRSKFGPNLKMVFKKIQTIGRTVRD